MQLIKLSIKNFRCFSQQNLDFNSPIILIEGQNGSGKTSILEALHYLGYLRSFRTHISKDLINLESENFFIKATFTEKFNTETNNLQVGFSGKKRLVKINDKTIQSYKELIDYYRVITLTEDDLNLIKGGPDLRRSFLDQHILLCDPNFLLISKKYKQILENRNALLFKNFNKKEKIDDTYILWTKQLWEQSKIIQRLRKEALKLIEYNVNQLFVNYFNEKINAHFQYESKNEYLNFDDFLNNNTNLYENELRHSRSLFGAHLDDFSIIFLDKKSRIYASRGQQKLLILMLKIAQIKNLEENIGFTLFLLDDFMTDFDLEKLQRAIPMLFDIKSQIIFTSPIKEGILKDLLLAKNAQIISL